MNTTRKLRLRACGRPVAGRPPGMSTTPPTVRTTCEHGSKSTQSEAKAGPRGSAAGQRGLPARSVSLRLSWIGRIEVGASRGVRFPKPSAGLRPLGSAAWHRLVPPVRRSSIGSLSRGPLRPVCITDGSAATSLVNRHPATMGFQAAGSTQAQARTRDARGRSKRSRAGLGRGPAGARLADRDRLSGRTVDVDLFDRRCIEVRDLVRPRDRSARAPARSSGVRGVAAAMGEDLEQAASVQGTHPRDSG